MLYTSNAAEGSGLDVPTAICPIDVKGLNPSAVRNNKNLFIYIMYKKLAKFLKIHIIYLIVFYEICYLNCLIILFLLELNNNYINENLIFDTNTTHFNK